MKQAVAKKWVKALRSGKYEQGAGVLKTEDGRFCCLGVLTDVLGEKCQPGRENLTRKVMRLAGMKTNIGERPDTEDGFMNDNLAELNDSCAYSFKEIADVIEKEYKGL